LILPVGELGLENFSLQMLALPDGKVGILDGEFGKR
jgi:hypothetical protein